MTENEQLRNNIEIVFSYARTYVANANPSAENEMLAMVNIKAGTIISIGTAKGFGSSIQLASGSVTLILK